MRTLTVAAILLVGTTGAVVAKDNQSGWGFFNKDQLQNASHHRGGRGGGMKMLETFDTDGDGAVTQAEIDAYRANQIAEADANGDGVLSLEEYEAVWAKATRERMVDQFQAHDADGDGSVTAEEFNARFDGLVERMDQNGDGLLDSEDRPERGARGERGGRGGEGRKGNR